MLHNVDLPYCSKIPVEIVLSRTPAGGEEFFQVSRVRTRIFCLRGFFACVRLVSRMLKWKKLACTISSRTLIST
jgi:hypothetical protein